MATLHLLRPLSPPATSITKVPNLYPFLPLSWKPNHVTTLFSRSSHLVLSSSNDVNKHVNKQVINVTPQLYDYILANVREPEILRMLREETAPMRGSGMQVAPDQGQLLAMLVQILGAERCIELGVYTGYSSLAVALVLPDSGRLVACERDEKALETARKYYELAGVSHKVDVRHGLAVDTLKSLILNGEVCSYDYAFVDAEKRMYSEYFELLLQLVKVGGVIVFDNVLWYGKVADPLVNDPQTISIRNFNRTLMEDNRVSISMVDAGSISRFLLNESELPYILAILKPYGSESMFAKFSSSSPPSTTSNME